MKFNKIKYIIIVLLLLLLLMIYYLSYYNSISKINTNENIVFLTFDDGPSLNTLQVLDILKEKNVSATFFLICNNVKEHPNIIDLIKEQNHDIGIHTMSHPYLYKNMSNELTMCKFILENKLNKQVFLFRPPYGFSTPLLMQESNNLNLKMILWDVFPRDYEKNSTEILLNINNNVRQGSIIVLHDGSGNRSEMVNALHQIIDLIRRKGFKFGLLTDYITPN